MSQFSTSPQTQVSDKAACLNCGALTEHFPHACDWCIDRLLAVPSQFAINFGGQETAHTPYSVPLGNTGTTTGHFL